MCLDARGVGGAAAIISNGSILPCIIESFHLAFQRHRGGLAVEKGADVGGREVEVAEGSFLNAVCVCMCAWESFMSERHGKEKQVDVALRVA